MSNRRLIDTNLIVRHLVQDNERQAKVAAKLFLACDCGEVILVVLPAVVAECVFVLESFYKHSRIAIAQVLGQLFRSSGVELSELEVCLDALDRYARTKVHFVDCVIAATAAARQFPVATFDSDFKKFTDVIVTIE